MPRHHTIISGTGRAGTTFLMQLLTALGLDTGFTDLTSGVSANCNAGMETDIRKPDAPYLIKSPWLCDDLEDIIDRQDVVIDRAIIPVRDLYSAAESRRDVTRRTDATLYQGPAPGGLWHTDDPERTSSLSSRFLLRAATRPLTSHLRSRRGDLDISTGESDLAPDAIGQVTRCQTPI